MTALPDVVGAIARDAWTRDHDPSRIEGLLREGLADPETQRVAADIIALAMMQKLPAPNATKAAKELRDVEIALHIQYALEFGIGVGAAMREAAELFGIGYERVRQIWRRRDLRLEAARIDKELLASYDD